MTAHHAFLHCLVVKWCLTFQETFLKEQWNKSASKQQNTKISPIPDWSCPMYFTGVGYGVLSPPLVLITLIETSEKYWLALHMTTNWNCVVKTVSVFPVPLEGVPLLDKVPSSPLLMGGNPAQLRGHTSASLTTTPVLTNYKERWPFILKATSLKKGFFKKCILWRQGKSYSKTRLITVEDKHFQIKTSDSEESAVLSQYTESTRGVHTLPIIAELWR